jgi:hypothetical protein
MCFTHVLFSSFDHEQVKFKALSGFRLALVFRALSSSCTLSF